jgi:serine/threonine protein phosphatase 1
MIWVIGDIHGMFDHLKGLITSIRYYEEPDDPVEKLIFIGDYIDYGPSSKEVIDFIIDLDYDKVLLMGDHEDFAVRFYKYDENIPNHSNFMKIICRSTCLMQVENQPL